MGAGPSLDGEALSQPFTEGTVETGVVSDHQMGRLDERLDGIEIDYLTLHHIGCNPCQARDLGRDGDRGLPQGIEGTDDIADATVLIIRERHHTDLNDLVPGMVETCGFGIHDDGELFAWDSHPRGDDRSGLET